MATNDEDWFYDSISRYKNLNMFEMEYPVDCIELASSNSICVCCSDKQQHQLLELVLPQKLTSPSTLGGVITNDTDLKIKCGTFTSSRIAHMRNSPSDHVIIASQYDMNGVNFYQLTLDDSDEINKTQTINCELESPFLALSDIILVVTKTVANPVFLMDIKTGYVIKNIVLSEKGSNEEFISPANVDPNVIAMCNHSSGTIQLYDSRDCKVLYTCTGPEEKNNDWCFTTLYESSPTSAHSIQTTGLAAVSNKGILRVFDSRNWTVPYLNKRLDVKYTERSPIQIRFKPSNKSWISVSGFDGNVYVYKLDSEPEQVFVHDGHRHVEDFSSDTITSSHVWFPNIDNLVISSAHNGTVQSWQFEDSVKLTTA